MRKKLPFFPGSQKKYGKVALQMDIVMGYMILVIVIVVGILGYVLWDKFAPHDKQIEKEMAKIVIKTRILDVSGTAVSKGSVASSAGRAIVGNAVAGPLGAIIGANTGKRTTTEYRSTTFKVWYWDGSTKIVTVPNNSAAYKEYVDALED